jgi:hypothetical protein
MILLFYFKDKVEDYVKEFTGGYDDDDERVEEDFEDNKEDTEEIEKKKKIEIDIFE